MMAENTIYPQKQIKLRIVLKYHAQIKRIAEEYVIPRQRHFKRICNSSLLGMLAACQIMSPVSNEKKPIFRTDVYLYWF